MTRKLIHSAVVALVLHLVLVGALAFNSSGQTRPASRPFGKGHAFGTSRPVESGLPPNSLFPTPTSYDSGGGQARAMAVGDFNGDGVQDIAVANACADGFNCSDISGVVGILLGNSDGTFQAAQTYSSGGQLAVSIAAGDINGDGKMDLAVANECGIDPNCAGGGFGTGYAGVLLGNGDGTFQPATIYVVDFFITFVALADLNADGKADLVASTTDPTFFVPSVTVLLSDPTGTLQFASRYDVGGETTSHGFVTVADLNADGKADLVVTNQCTGCTLNVSLLMGNGDGTFLPPVFLASGGEATSVAVADLNQDGLKDLVVSNRCGLNCPGFGTVAVLLADLAGSYQTAQTYDVATGFDNHVAVGDVNQDGIADLVVANGCTCTGQFPGEAEVFLGNGNGTFQSPQSYDSGGDNPLFVVIGDFNQDGKTDVVVANELAVPSPDLHGNIAVLLGEAATNTSTILTASPSNPVYAQSVTLTAVVTSAGNGTPTGTVTFLDGATIIGSTDLVSGQASISTSVLAVGTHLLTSSYPGNSNFNGSSSSPVPLTVALAGTQSLLSSSPNPSLVAEAVTFTATVIPSSGGGATGTVSFFEGATNLGTFAVSGGVAALNISVLTQGTHSITAVYSGDGNFSGSTSGVLNQAVQLATATSLTSSLNPSTFGQQVLFTATVTSTSGTPHGTVTFTANNKVLGNVTLLGGSAALGTSNLKVGSTQVIATYNGSNFFRGSSGTVIQTVNGAVSTTTTITGSSSNPSIYGDTVTFTAAVTSTGGTPTGNVRFKLRSTVLGQAALSNGVVTLTTSAGQLPGGADPIVATYLGTGQFTGSSSSPFYQTVNQTNSATSLTSSANPSSPGQTVTFTATVTGAYAIPTGKVRFRDGSQLLAIVPLTNGVALYTTTSLSGGTHNITASYLSDLNYTPSSANVQQLVQ